MFRVPESGEERRKLFKKWWVWDVNYKNKEKRILLFDRGRGFTFPFVCVHCSSEVDFYNGREYTIINYQNAEEIHEPKIVPFSTTEEAFWALVGLPIRRMGVKELCGIVSDYNGPYVLTNTIGINLENLLFCEYPDRETKTWKPCGKMGE